MKTTTSLTVKSEKGKEKGREIEERRDHLQSHQCVNELRRGRGRILLVNLLLLFDSLSAFLSRCRFCCCFTCTGRGEIERGRLKVMLGCINVAVSVILFDVKGRKEG